MRLSSELSEMVVNFRRAVVSTCGKEKAWTDEGLKTFAL